MEKTVGAISVFVLLTFISPLGASDENVPAGEVPEETGRVPETSYKVPEFFVTPPPFSDDVFPCSDCHEDMDVNPERRILEEEHTEISEGFDHARQQRWCLDCHDSEDRDQLRLANGELVSFEKSYLLCGQCHGTILRDWKVGIHGKRTGEWNGQKKYRLCVNCHYPHWPAFQGFKPLPPPVRSITWCFCFPTRNTVLLCRPGLPWAKS